VSASEALGTYSTTASKSGRAGTVGELSAGGAVGAAPDIGPGTPDGNVATSPDIVAVADAIRLGSAAPAAADGWSPADRSSGDRSGLARRCDGVLGGRGGSQWVAQAAGTGDGSASTPNVGRLTATVDALRVFSNGAQVAGGDVCAASVVTTRLASRSRRSRCRSAWTSRADW
jgi:hypothetical protein